MSVTYTTPKEAVMTMARVIYALILRETKTRYGRLKIGYLWAFLEPMLFITVLSIIFTYVRKLHSTNMPPILFYITGIMPFFLFRDIMIQTMLAIRSNIQLLTFPQVQVLDLIIARAILELSTFIVVFTVLVSTVGFAHINPVNIEDFLRLFEAIMLISLLGFGAGLGAASLVPLFPTVQFLIVAIIIRPLFFISGIFFTADVIPDSIRTYALFNPLLQCVEMFRSAFFYEFESGYVNRTYTYGFVLCTLSFGLLLQRALKRYATRT